MTDEERERKVATLRMEGFHITGREGSCMTFWNRGTGAHAWIDTATGEIIRGLGNCLTHSGVLP